MIKDSEFSGFAESCINEIIQLPDLTVPVYRLITGMRTFRNTGIRETADRLLAFCSVQRKELSEKISPGFSEFAEDVLNGYTGKAIISAFPDFGFEAVFSGLESYPAKQFIPLRLLELYKEINISHQEKPKEAEKPENGVITFSDQTEDAIRVHIENKGNDSSAAGRTIQAHLMAEDYGLDKDRLFSMAMPKYITSSSPREIISRWFRSNDDHSIGNVYLKWLHPHSVDYHASEYNSVRYKPVLDAYYKKSLQALIEMLEESKWYKVEDLWQCYKDSTLPIYLNDERMIDSDFFSSLPNADDSSEEQKEKLLRKPIFEGMLYTIAVLGAIDITEKAPETPIHINSRKLVPYSPLDAIDKISLTGFGRWVLSLSDKKPEPSNPESVPILDRDLLLIKYNGHDVKLSGFLKEIGEPLGSLGYKVTTKSFLRNTSYERNQETLVREFREYFPAPPENWERFLANVIDSHEIIKLKSQGFLFSVNSFPAVMEILDDEKMSPMIKKVEGGYVYIDKDDIKRFAALIKKRGYNLSL